jgi:sec-independent protein translocase protein TatA
MGEASVGIPLYFCGLTKSLPVMTRNLLVGIGGLGVWEILLIVLAILVLFGAKRIPEFAKGLGQGIREFKNAANNVKEEVRREVEAADNATNNPPTPPKA